MAQRYAYVLTAFVALLLLLPSSAFAQNEEIVGNLCVGIDCQPPETFGESVIKLKDINARILFEDDSTPGGSFPSNDWQLTANSSISGGASFFAIDDITADTTPFFVEAAAQTNALVVSDFDNSSGSGYVGIGTADPQMELHIFHGDTPGIRLEQDNSELFGAYAWDVAANENNFVIRDITADEDMSGGLIPFRIYPGTNTGTMTLSTNDRVGIGTTVPTTTLHLQADAPTMRVENTTSSTDVFRLDDNGNLTLSGVLTEASSMHLKENREAVNPADVLDTLKDLPIETWNYRTDEHGLRHMGPMAQTFYAAFGLGVDEEHLAPLDANGVALAAIQGLLSRVEQLERDAAKRDDDMAALRQENEALNRRMDRLEQMVQQQIQQNGQQNAEADRSGAPSAAGDVE